MCLLNILLCKTTSPDIVPTLGARAPLFFDLFDGLEWRDERWKLHLLDYELFEFDNSQRSRCKWYKRNEHEQPDGPNSGKEKSKTLFYFYKRSSVIFCMNAGYLPSNLRSLYDSRHVCMQLQLQARQRYHSSMIQHVCIHGETFVINQSERNTARKI